MTVNFIIFFVILIILITLFRYSKSYKEGFFDFPDQSHNNFVNESALKFNKLTNTINLTNPVIDLSPSLSNNFNNALSTLDTEPTKTSFNLIKKYNYSIPSDKPDTLKMAEMCESYGTDCSAFDNPDFSANCGISFDINTIKSDGKAHIGGLYISEQDRQQQFSKAENILTSNIPPYDPYLVYQPTIGKAKSGTFSLTKDQCVVVKEKVDCKSKQTFNSPNCTQCYTSQGFSRVDPTTPKIPSTLYLYGSGNVSIISSSLNITVNNTSLDIATPITISIPSNAEGNEFIIQVENTPTNIIPYVAGYIEGQVPLGSFKLDLIHIIQSDLITNLKPRINGTITVNDFTSLSIIPGVKQNSIKLSCMIPFSFLSMYDGDALTCENGPIITQATSATFLDSDPCFSKENKPGNYKLECLQSRWIELGGTQQGTGYPQNKTTADSIQLDVNGNPLDIDTIINNIVPKLKSAITGLDANGKPLSINNWNTLSMWATGTPINTPCDGPNTSNGPLTQECLSYLYFNEGINSHIGPTYTLQPFNNASMKGQNTQNTYCQQNTSIDPNTALGLQFGLSLGGINNVKQTYDTINRLANDNTLDNTTRSTAIMQCYGINIDKVSTI